MTAAQPVCSHSRPKIIGRVDSCGGGGVERSGLQAGDQQRGL
jgi:hypothetical protein